MQSKIQTYLAVFLLLAVGCSGNTVSRTAGSETSVEPGSSSKGDDGTGKKGTDQGGQDNVVGVSEFIPITGVNLVEVTVRAKCTSEACTELLFDATITAGKQAPLAFVKRNLAVLGIDHGTWEIQGMDCDSHSYNPRCKSLNNSLGSLSGFIPKATLTIVDGNGKEYSGKTPAQPVGSYDGMIKGNFMRVAVVGQGPTGKTAYGDDAVSSGRLLWTEMWRDINNGLEFTNPLYSGIGGSIDNNDGPNSAKELCEKLSLRRPTILELCGTGYNSSGMSGNCDGGLFFNGIKDLTFSSWNWNTAVWSSSPVVGSTTNAWFANLSTGGSYSYDKGNSNFGVFCVRE